MIEIAQDSAIERVILVGLSSGRMEAGLDSLEEIRQLAESAGAEVAGAIVARQPAKHSPVLIGRGKCSELSEKVQELSATLVVVDCPVSPIQERNLEREVQCRVIDRTGLILDIFAQRASSREGQLQIELAQLRHISTRLVRGWTHLERQKGGIGLRGPGETQLETDRRLIGRRIKTVAERLERIRTQRQLRRRSREKVPFPTIALVGYTNAGKSTLFNRLTGSSVMAADQLFSTLDPTMRRVQLPGYGTVILSDTVGFIRELPHSLVSAFRATLEEVAAADLLVHVVDASSADVEERMSNVEEVLDEIGASEIPRLLVYNKIDLTRDSPAVIRGEDHEVVRIWLSVQSGEGVDFLTQAMGEYFRATLQACSICLPICAAKLRSSVYERIEVTGESIMDSGEAVLDIELSEKDFGWLVSNQEFRDDYWRVRPQFAINKD